MVRHPGASAVVPFLDPPDDPDPRIVLVHQYRYAAGGGIWEIPAGVPGSDEESWDECARRELAEETGYVASELRYLGRILTTPGFTDEVIHLFVATGLRMGPACHDPDEFIEVVPTRRARVLQMIRRGELVDAKSVSALLFTTTFAEVLDGRPELPPSR